MTDEKDERQPVFSGTTKECLKHYGATMPIGEKDCSRYRILLAEFTKASIERTVPYWLSGKRPPLGVFLLKVRYFLEEVAYQVNELEKLSPQVYSFGRFVAFDILKINEATDMVKLAREQQLIRILHGDCGLSTPKSLLMEEANEAFRDDLDKKVEEWRERFEEERKRVEEVIARRETERHPKAVAITAEVSEEPTAAISGKEILHAVVLPVLEAAPASAVAAEPLPAEIAVVEEPAVIFVVEQAPPCLGARETHQADEALPTTTFASGAGVAAIVEKPTVTMPALEEREESEPSPKEEPFNGAGLSTAPLEKVTVLTAGTPEKPAPRTLAVVKSGVSEEYLLLQAMAGHINAANELAKKVGAAKCHTTRAIIFDELARLVRAMAPLAEYALSDEVSDDERSKLREAIDNGFGIFRLSRKLSRLCGERAMREIKEQ
ncbi:MAG: hypothetical protein HYV53_03235 [Parcubacteria group bacterium]|nr:hypothetical protein [Parcubacteria group bacterium]